MKLAPENATPIDLLRFVKDKGSRLPLDELREQRPYTLRLAIAIAPFLAGASADNHEGYAYDYPVSIESIAPHKSGKITERILPGLVTVSFIPLESVNSPHETDATDERIVKPNGIIPFGFLGAVLKVDRGYFLEYQSPPHRPSLND